MSTKADKVGRDSQREGALPVYRAPWRGQLLLACGKCRKKLRKSSEPAEAANLKKLLKACGKQGEERFRLRVIEVPCLKLCPKGGVTVCTQQQLGRGECSIVRTQLDVETLYAEAKGYKGDQERAG